ncbi:MATE family efflux transporter [Rhizobium halophytocola]|uniref:MATE family efflux protein n=1 Tax=Rhizobium halophytocola TaxID=735519 RepID=A0ABS4E0A3_9HYPH|nr:MATE family efflux transporter [Rhizobium halophytocola]MBP1851362.1 putative MATE family efflux protein [Rhizobium halophytocola]
MDSPASARQTGGAFPVTHRLVLSIAIPMTLGFLTTPLLGLTDTAVAGRTGEAAALAGLAVGAALFDLIFASLNFLRSSTTGLTAQAYGRGDRHEQQAVFWRSMVLSIAVGLTILALSPLLLPLGLWLMGPTGAVAVATTTYFSIRIIAGPLTLANYTLLGFILGRGQGRNGLLLQAILNGTNIVLSIYLGLTLKWGIAGVAWGTLFGEGAAFLAGLGMVLYQFRGEARPTLREIFDGAQLKRLFSLNRDILVRSFSLLAAFTLVTRIGTGFGPTVLAANAILMNIFLVAGYYLDGFANAAETITGRAIGANYRAGFVRAVRLTAIWSFALAAVTTAFFLVFGDAVIDLLTTAPEVRDTAYVYLPWAALTALTGALAFQMDGVFIGATWSVEMRNMMVAALVGFLLSLAVLVPLAGNHGLWAALNLFLAMRGIFLLLRLKPKLDQTFAESQ